MNQTNSRVGKIREDSPLYQLMQNYAQAGTVTWLGIRPIARADLKVVENLQVSIEEGVIGDHFIGKVSKSRQVTLIQAEHLQVVASFLGISAVNPALIRRNIVVEGINIWSLKDKTFQIGEAILEMTGECHPCSRMEENLGHGGYNAMRGHGGITAKVIQGGGISLGDEVRALF
jgi:MOSC domain-containing protein YiiM